MSEPLYEIGQQIIFYYPKRPDEGELAEFVLSGVIREIAHSFEQPQFIDDRRLYPVVLKGFPPEPGEWLYWVELDPDQHGPNYPDRTLENGEIIIGGPIAFDVIAEDLITQDEIPF